MTNQAIENGLSDMIMGTKLALRSVVWFGFGYHAAHIEGDKEARAYLDQVRAGVLAAGKVKSEASARVSQAKGLGAVFGERFAAELASDYASEAHRIQACYMAMVASGVTSVKKLADWVTHGDAEHTAKQEAAKRAEHDAASKKAAEDMISGATMVQGLDIDAKPEPVTAPETDAAPVADAGPETGATVQNLNLSSLTDAELDELATAIAAEITARATVEAETVAA
jgi:hypothetical protein